MLAIDDSITVLQLISTVLSSKGHEVETATSGKEGLAKYTRFRPDIVTLDLAMPTMDGYDTLTTLKSLDKYANVLMLTAANHSSALQRCLREGAIDFISKPFSASDILNAMDRAMKSRKYCNHDAAAFFSQLKNKLQHAVKSSFPDDYSLELKNVQTIWNVAPSRGEYGDAQWLDCMPSEDDICFVTRMAGEKEGIVMSLIKNEDMRILFNTEDAGKGKVPDNVVEFFNMINMKVVSDLADSTHSKIDGHPAMFFANPRRMSNLWNETARMWDRIEFGMFEMTRSGKMIPLTIQLWCDGGLFT